MGNIINKIKMAGAKLISLLIISFNRIKMITGKIPLGWLKRLRLGRRSKKILAGVIILLGLSQLIFAILIYGFHQDNKPVRVAVSLIPFPVAVADFDIVTYKDYLVERDYVHHFYAATKQDNVGYSEIDKQILDQLIENKLVGFQAGINHIKVSAADIDSSISSIVEQNGGQDKVEKVLQDYYGINLAQFRKLVRDQLIRDKVSNELITKIEARHILVRVDNDAPDDQVAAAKAKIDGYLTEIKGGLDFSEAAKKYSEDTGSAAQGGELEPFARGEMVEEFSNTAFSTPVGTISEPVKSEFGWHIIKVEAKTGKIDMEFTDWLASLKNKGIILRFI